MIMQKKWLEWSAAAGSIAVFLSWKLTHLVFRFGDGNAYIYMADALWRGMLPYRDFFLADPPVFVLLLAALKPVFGGHLILYQAIPVVLEAGAALLLFLLQ